jgi:hypothetical protein
MEVDKLKIYAAPAGALISYFAFTHDWRRGLLLCRHSVTENSPLVSLNKYELYDSGKDER